MQIQRSNTILYCERFADMVAFYRDVLRLDVAFENEWFVEFSLGSGAFLSVADATRASIRSGDGRGLTMSWRVADVHEARAALIASGVDAAEVRTRWGKPVLDVFDPSGNRIELWSDSTADDDGVSRV